MAVGSGRVCEVKLEAQDIKRVESQDLFRLINDPPENEGDPSYNLLGNWSLTGEMPTEGHGVLVEDMDSCEGDPGEIGLDFRVVKVGKVVG